ncbi:hypothetical protein [Sphingobacterium sp. 2149]|uniref:hypothetical protein n=1 Tax=Sphingobacterium sp. 2149 TaxID=2817763 RepID=UPI002857FF74|nr:hypothetical protein [Sphingobacterium sp. 2149]MDR6735502.1 hypothetical protein [Sphingobacterium sp. 2149]
MKKWSEENNGLFKKTWGIPLYPPPVPAPPAQPIVPKNSTLHPLHALFPLLSVVIEVTPLYPQLHQSTLP